MIRLKFLLVSAVSTKKRYLHFSENQIGLSYSNVNSAESQSQTITVILSGSVWANDSESVSVLVFEPVASVETGFLWKDYCGNFSKLFLELTLQILQFFEKEKKNLSPLFSPKLVFLYAYYIIYWFKFVRYQRVKSEKIK